MVSKSEMEQCLDCLRTVLRSSIQLIDALIAVSCRHQSASQIRCESTSVPSPVDGALTMLLQAAGASSHTILRLSDSPGLQTRDCYSIARSVVEVAVNACFIMAEGEVMAERAFRHARQKSIQDMERESTIGESDIHLVFSVKSSLAELEGMEQEIAEFTSRDGREKGWVDLSIDKRIEAVGKRFGKSLLEMLHYVRFMIYRHSSEVLHGTLFGAMHFFGKTQPCGRPITVDQFRDHIDQQQMLILMATNFSLLATVKAFHQAYGFQSAFDESERLIDAMRKIALFNAQNDA